MNEPLLRELVPAVIGVLVRRGADFASAEDAVQEAVIRALEAWPEEQPHNPKAWLISVAWRKFLDAARAETARREREQAVVAAPPRGPGPAMGATTCSAVRGSSDGADRILGRPQVGGVSSRSKRGAPSMKSVQSG